MLRLGVQETLCVSSAFAFVRCAAPRRARFQRVYLYKCVDRSASPSGGPHHARAQTNDRAKLKELALEPRACAAVARAFGEREEGEREKREKREPGVKRDERARASEARRMERERKRKREESVRNARAGRERWCEKMKPSDYTTAWVKMEFRRAPVFMGGWMENELGDMSASRVILVGKTNVWSLRNRRH